MNKPASDPLKDLPRLTDEAMGPCVCCKRQLLETEIPIFYRVEVKHCGLDAREIQRHVGLAMSIAPGRDGLALAGIMGPRVKPVVVMDAHAAFNVCNDCAVMKQIPLIFALSLHQERASTDAENKGAGE
jgi:hypothetical protein